MFKKYTHKILFLVFISLSLASCGGGSGTTSFANQDDQGQSGSGSGSGGNSVPTGNQSLTVNWDVPTKNSDGSNLTDLSGYKIYYGISSNSLAKVVSVSLGYTSFTIENLASNTKYYFAIKAINSKNVESFFSNVVNKTTTG